MSHFVTPRVFSVAATGMDYPGLKEYLQYTHNDEFLESVKAALIAGCTDAEVLIALMAKLCYKSLTLGQNENITKVRDIPDNVANVISSAHGSVMGHFNLSFIVTDCSRVATHELVRHGIGTAFSQTSGRFVRSSEISLVFDPILDPIRAESVELLEYLEAWYNARVKQLGLDQMTNFTAKKKMTSALRRFMPNGQSNEIGVTLNLRAVRHTLQIRTQPAAEYEIRLIFGQIYEIVKAKYPALVADAKTKVVDGALMVYGMKMQPYDQLPLDEIATADLEAELDYRREAARTAITAAFLPS